MSKLKMWQIHLIGVLASLIVGLILYFALVKPKNEQVTAAQAEVAGIRDQGGTQEKVTTQQGAAKKEEAGARLVQAQWKKSADYYMPTLTLGNDVFQAWEYNGYRDRDTNKYYGIKDLPIVWGRWVTAWYDAQKNQGVSLQPGTGFPINAIGNNDPNFVSQITSLQFPLNGTWPVALEAKNFNAAMNHLRKINGMQHHGMPVINNVSLSGQSPNLAMNYDLGMYVITEKDPPPADPMLGGAGAAAPGGTPGGFGGGMPPGFSGSYGGSMMGGPRGRPGAAGAGAPAGGGKGGAAAD